jgi:hypothetical protein
LSSSHSSKKYAEFKANICYRFPVKNDYDGYYIRELIPEEVAYEILLSSNSKISKKFKKDVSKIIADLRKSNKLVINNADIKLKRNNSVKNMKMNVIETHNDSVLSFNNPNDMDLLLQLVIDGAKFTISAFNKCHVMYLVFINLDDGNGSVIIKFGYTEDIIERLQSLEKEYNTDIIFLNCKAIKGESSEREFHKILKNSYPDAIYEHTIKDTKKTELYKFSRILLDEYNNYDSGIEQPTEEQELDDEQMLILKSLRYQEDTIVNLISKKNNNDKSVWKYMYKRIERDIIESNNNKDIKIAEINNILKMRQLEREKEKEDHKYRMANINKNNNKNKKGKKRTG